MMETILLGASSLRISRIGFGCMSLGGDEAANTKLIQSAIDRGINFFDTADLYEKGMNEELLGKIFQGRRGQVVLATKVGNQWREDGSGWDWNASKDYILRAAEKSLRRLRTDHIDLYQLHGGVLEDPIDDTIEAFELLQQQGKIRYYGISSIRPAVIREYVRRSHIVSVMMQYGLLDRRPEESALSLLREKGIGVLARGSLAKGLLVDKPASDWLGYRAEEVAGMAEKVRSLSGENVRRSAGQTAIRFVLEQPAISAAVVGIRTETQLADAAGVFDSPALTGEEWSSLGSALPPLRYESPHR